MVPESRHVSGFGGVEIVHALRFFMKAIAADGKAVVEERFRTRTDSADQSWQPLSHAWRARKARPGVLYHMLIRFTEHSHSLYCPHVRW